MKININEDDVENTLGKSEASVQFPPEEGDLLLGDMEEKVNRMANVLPRVVATKIGGMTPDGFMLGEIEFKFSISGKPFGVGVGGEVVAKFQQVQIED